VTIQETFYETIKIVTSEFPSERKNLS
jgi:hypothetical protein